MIKLLAKKWHWIFVGMGVAVVLFCGVFHHRVLTYGVKFYLDMIHPMEGGWSVDYVRCRFENKNIRFTDIDVLSHNQGVHIHLDRLDFRWIPYLSQSIRPKIAIFNPSLSIDMRNISEVRTFSFSSFLQYSSGKIAIDNGTATITNKNGLVIPLYFSLINDQQPRCWGTLLLSHQPDTFDSPDVGVKLYTWPRETIAEVELQEASLPWISELLDVCSCHVHPFAIVRDGDISGKLWIGLRPDNTLSQINATMSASNFAAINAAQDVETSFHELHLNMSYPTGKRATKNFSWQNCVLKSELQGGRIHYNDPKKANEYALCKLNGSVVFNSLKDSSIEVEGFLDQRGNLSPVVLNGKPSVANPNTLDLNLRLFLESATEHTTQLGLSLTARDDDRYAIKGILEDLSTEQLGVIQHVIGLGYPPINDFLISQGTISLTLGALLDKGEIHECFVEELVAHNLELYWKSAGLRGHCSQCILTADFDMHMDDPFSFPDLSLIVEKGEVIKQEEWHITDLDMNVAVEKGSFLTSRLQGDLFDCWTELTFSGSYEDLDLQAECHMDRDWILSQFTTAVASDVPLAETIARFNIHRSRGEWDVLGNFSCTFDHFPTEILEYGCTINDRIFAPHQGNWLDLYRQAISKGWFRSDQCSEKSLLFLADCLGVRTRGCGNIFFTGTFDASSVLIDLQSGPLRLENEDFSIHTLSLGHSQLCYDFDTQTWQGTAPLRQTSLKIKDIGLKFHDISTCISFIDHTLELDTLQLESEGVSFSGKGRITFTDREIDSYLFHAHSASGSALQVEQFLQHFPTLAATSFPFDGKVETLAEGVVFAAQKLEENWNIDWGVGCRLTHGTLHMDHYQIEDVKFDLHFDSTLSLVSLIDLKGRLPCTDGTFKQLYAKELALLLGKSSTLSGDVRVQNSMIDLMRLVFEGTYDTVNTSWQFQFHPTKSHLFNQPFTCAQCSCSPSQGITHLDGSFTLPLQYLEDVVALCSYLHLFGQPNLFDTNDIPSMDGSLVFSINGDEDLWNLSILGENLRLGTQTFAESRLHLVQNGCLWDLKELILDGIVMRSKILQQSNHWHIFDTFVQYGETSLAIEEGMFCPADRQFHLPIESMTLDSTSISSSLRGLCDVTGYIDCQLPSISSPLALEGLLTLTSKEPINDQFILETTLPLEWCYLPQKGLNINRGKILITEHSHPETLCTVACDHVQIFTKEHLNVAGIDLSLTNGSLQKWCSVFFPNEDPAIIAEHFPYAWNDYTHCRLCLQREGSHYTLTGSFPEGYYQFLHHYRHLHRLSFTLTNDLLRVSSSIPFFQDTMQIESHIVTHAPYLTEIKAYACKGDIPQTKEALRMHLSLLTPQGLTIHGVTGDVCGCTFSFLPKPMIVGHPTHMTFLGNIKVDGNALLEYTAGDLHECLQDLQVGSGYEVSGEATFSKKDPEIWTFDGFVKGKNFHLLGYEFNTMLGELQVDAEKASIKNLKVSDESINMAIPLVQSQRETNGWQVYVPEILFSDVRPSLIRTPEHSPTTITAFRIPQMVFQDVVGWLHDFDTFTGKGTLVFENSFKKEHHFLDVPIELISRLGLDTSLLVPIYGEMDYVIKNGKVVFTKMRNSFSEGKRSHFYLSHKHPSYVDFDGNICLQIKMKQYVLFKFTELFLLSVRGTLDNPQFALK